MGWKKRAVEAVTVAGMLSAGGAGVASGNPVGVLGGGVLLGAAAVAARDDGVKEGKRQAEIGSLFWEYVDDVDGLGPETIAETPGEFANYVVRLGLADEAEARQWGQAMAKELEERRLAAEQEAEDESYGEDED